MPAIKGRSAAAGSLLRNLIHTLSPLDMDVSTDLDTQSELVVEKDCTRAPFFLTSAMQLALFDTDI